MRENMANCQIKIARWTEEAEIDKDDDIELERKPISVCLPDWFDNQ